MTGHDARIVRVSRVSVRMSSTRLMVIDSAVVLAKPAACSYPVPAVTIRMGGCKWVIQVAGSSSMHSMNKQWRVGNVLAER